MKQMFLLLLLSLTCYQSHAQVGGLISKGKISYRFPCIEYEYISVYYYDFNTLKSKEAVLYTTYVNFDEQENNIIMGDNIRDYVKPLDGGGLEQTRQGVEINLKNLIICNHAAPSNELERRYQYKFLYNGLWYYFNSGLELFPQPEKKSFKDKLKELLFK